MRYDGMDGEEKNEWGGLTEKTVAVVMDEEQVRTLF